MIPRTLEAEDGTEVRTSVLPRQAGSSFAARRLVRDALMGWALAALADDVELVLAELVSNAVRHARTDVIRVSVWHENCVRVRVAVTDMSRALPQRKYVNPDSPGGRGLAIIEAVSERWGVDPLPWGKRVWADLELPHSVAELPLAPHALEVPPCSR